MSVVAHFRTVWPVVRRVAGTTAAPVSEPWSVEVPDPDMGRVLLTGLLTRVPASSAVLVLVHGLGGSTESSYMRRTARVAESMGLSCLRLNLRGADRGGEDLYHAGLSEDLRWVVASPELARFDSILLFGFSLGGHMGLRFATEVEDPRVRAVAAACSPLDLDRCVQAIDRPVCWLYRRYVLAGLCDMYARVASRRPLPLSVAEARRIRTIRDWDRHTVVPRFGFTSPEDYYHRAGVGRRLDRLKVPALLLVAEDDPMVPRAAVECALGTASSKLETRWVRQGGHLGFATGLDLGEETAPGLPSQVTGWLIRQLDPC